MIQQFSKINAKIIYMYIESVINMCYWPDYNIFISPSSVQGPGGNGNILIKKL